VVNVLITYHDTSRSYLLLTDTVLYSV